MREPARVRHDAVEMIAVHHQKPPSVGGFVDGVAGDFDARKTQARIVAEDFVVVARNIDDASPGIGLAQDFVDHRVVAVVPKPRARQTPSVDNVADEIKHVAFVVHEEIEKHLRLATARAEMRV